MSATATASPSTRLRKAAAEREAKVREDGIKSALLDKVATLAGEAKNQILNGHWSLAKAIAEAVAAGNAKGAVANAACIHRTQVSHYLRAVAAYPVAPSTVRDKERFVAICGGNLSRWEASENAAQRAKDAKEAGEAAAASVAGATGASRSVTDRLATLAKVLAAMLADGYGAIDVLACVESVYGWSDVSHALRHRERVHAEDAAAAAEAATVEVSCGGVVESVTPVALLADLSNMVVAA